MGIHARYYPSDCTATWGNQIYKSTGEPSNQGTDPDTDREHLHHNNRNDKMGDIIHEINHLRQENSGLALQLNVKEDFNGHADILEEVNRLRLMNMRLKLLQTKQSWSDTIDAVKTKPAHWNSSTNSTAREYSRTQSQRLESHDRRKHRLCKDHISTKDIFDRVDKLEHDVRKVIRKYSLPKDHQHRDTGPTFHHHAASHIAVAQTRESVNQYAASKTATRHGNTTMTSVDQVNTFEAEAKRIIAEYHKTKERRRSEITKNSANRSSVRNQASVRHRQAGQESSLRHSDSQNLEIGRHTSLTRDSQRNQTKSPKPIYCSTPKPMYSNTPKQVYSSNQDQFCKQLLRNTEHRQLGSGPKQDDFHSQISSADTCRSEYTGEHTDQQRKYGNYAVRNFQHIDEPIRKPQERLHEERSRLPSSEDTDTNSSRDQTDGGCMLLIVRPTRSLSGNVVGYDVAEDVHRKSGATNEEFQPMGDESDDINQEITLKLDTPFKFVLPTCGGTSVDEVRYNNSLSLSMAREWRGIGEDIVLSDKEPDSHATSTLVFDSDTQSLTCDESDVHKGDIVNNEDQEPDSYAMSTQDCDVDIVSLTDEKPACCQVPSTGECDVSIDSVAEDEPDCRTLKTYVNIESVTDEETGSRAYCTKGFDGTIESETDEEADRSALCAQVCNGNIESDTDEETDRSALCAQVCNGHIESDTDEETDRSALCTQVCNGHIESDTDEETDRSALCAQEYNRDIESVTDEKSDRQTLPRQVSDMDIVSVTDEEADCHTLTTEVCNGTILKADDVSAEGGSLEELEPVNNEYDSGPQSNYRNITKCGVMDSKPHSVIAETALKEDSVCLGTDKDEHTSGKTSAWIINRNTEASAKGTNESPFADQKNEDSLWFPVTDIGDGFPVREVEMTQVTRFHVSESDSSCIDWSDDKKKSVTTDKRVVPDCDTKIKKELENKTSYPDWDKDSDDYEGSRKDVEDILMLHDHHKRSASISNPDITKRTSASIIPSVTELYDHEQALPIKSSKNKPSEKDDVLDIVGNLTSGSDWDSDGDSEPRKSKINVTNGKLSPVQGTCSMTMGLNKLQMEGTGPVEVKSGSHDSDWDSESEVSGDLGGNMKTQVKDTVQDNVQNAENPKPQLNARDRNNEQQTLVELNAGLRKGHTSASDSDWGSDSSSLQNEKRTAVIKRNLSLTDILMQQDDQRKQPARIVVCEAKKKDSPIAHFGSENTDYVPTTRNTNHSREDPPAAKEAPEDAQDVASSSDWDSEDSESKKPESIACNERETTVQEIFLRNTNQETSLMVTSIPTVNDHELDVRKPSVALNGYKSDHGHDPGGVTGTLTVEGQKTASGSDWGSDTDESDDKKGDGTLFHDHRTNEPATILTITKEKHTALTNNDTSDHRNITGPLSNVLTEHKSSEVKTLVKEKTPRKEPQQSSDSNWDSDSDPSGDQPSAQDKSISHDDQGPQIAKLVVTNIEEKTLPVVPLAIVNADQGSSVDHIDGMHKDPQFSDELLDMVQKIDSYSDWDSDGESETEKPKSSIYIEKDSTQHANQKSFCDGNEDISPRKMVVSTVKCNELDAQKLSLATSACKSDHKSPEQHEIFGSLPVQFPNSTSVSGWDSDNDDSDDRKAKEAFLDDHRMRESVDILSVTEEKHNLVLHNDISDHRNTTGSLSNTLIEHKSPDQRKCIKDNTPREKPHQSSDSNWDSDSDPLEEQPSTEDVSISHDGQGKQIANFVASEIEKKVFPIVPLSIADHGSAMDYTDGIQKDHQASEEKPTTKEELLELHSFDSDSDWGSDGGSESEKRKISSFIGKDSAVQDHKMKESAVILSLTKDKHNALTNNDISDHTNITGSPTNILIEHTSSEEKTGFKDKTSREESNQGSDSNWDSDSDPLGDQPSVQDMSMSIDGQERQLANFAMSDMEVNVPNVPLAIADHGSTAIPTDGTHQIHQCSEKNPATKDELLDMVQNLDSDFDWDNDEESEAEKPKSSSFIGKNSTQHASQKSFCDDNEESLASTVKYEFDHQKPSLAPNACKSDSRSPKHHEITGKLPVEYPNSALLSEWDSDSDDLDDKKWTEALLNDILAHSEDHRRKESSVNAFTNDDTDIGLAAADRCDLENKNGSKIYPNEALDQTALECKPAAKDQESRDDSFDWDSDGDSESGENTQYGMDASAQEIDQEIQLAAKSVSREAKDSNSDRDSERESEPDNSNIIHPKGKFASVQEFTEKGPDNRGKHSPESNIAGKATKQDIPSPKRISFPEIDESSQYTEEENFVNGGFLKASKEKQSGCFESNLSDFDSDSTTSDLNEVGNEDHLNALVRQDTSSHNGCSNEDLTKENKNISKIVAKDEADKVEIHQSSDSSKDICYMADTVEVISLIPEQEEKRNAANSPNPESRRTSNRDQIDITLSQKLNESTKYRHNVGIERSDDEDISCIDLMDDNSDLEVRSISSVGEFTEKGPDNRRKHSPESNIAGSATKQDIPSPKRISFPDIDESSQYTEEENVVIGGFSKDSKEKQSGCFESNLSDFDSDSTTSDLNEVGNEDHLNALVRQNTSSHNGCSNEDLTKENKNISKFVAKDEADKVEIHQSSDSSKDICYMADTVEVISLIPEQKEKRNAANSPNPESRRTSDRDQIEITLSQKLNESTKYRHNVGIERSDDEDISCIDLMDDNSDLEARSISSVGDFQDDSCASSSNEEMPTNHGLVRSDRIARGIPSIDDFHGYTYETSSDDDRIECNHHEMERGLLGNKTGVQQNNVLLPDSSGPFQMNEDLDTDFVPKTTNSDMAYENDEVRIFPNVRFKDICVTGKDTETITKSDPVQERGISVLDFNDDSNKLSKAEFVKEVDELNFEDNCGTVAQTRPMSKQAPVTCISDLDFDEGSSNVAKAKHAEDVKSSDQDFSIPCIHLSDDISGLRNDNNISSDGDFQDYSYESSTDEDIPDRKVEMDIASSRKLTYEESSNIDLTNDGHDFLLDPRYDTGPTECNNTYRRIKDVLFAPNLSSGQRETFDGTPTTDNSMRTAMTSNFMKILMKEEDDRNTSHSHLNESNNSKDHDKSPRRDSRDQDNLSPGGALQKSAGLSSDITESQRLKVVSPEKTDDVIGIPPLDLGSYQTYCNSGKEQLMQNQYRKDFQPSHDDKFKEESIATQHKNTPIRVENVKRSTMSKRFTTKYLSKKKASVGANVCTTEQVIANGDAKITDQCQKTPIARERQYTAKYLARHNTTGSSGGTPDVRTERETDCQDPQPNASHRSRQFTDKYLARRHDQELLYPAKHLEEDATLRPDGNDGTPDHIEVTPKHTVIKNRYFTNKYLSTRPNRGDLNDGPTEATNSDTIRYRNGIPICGSDGGTTGGYNTKDIPGRGTHCIKTDAYHRKETPRHDYNCSDTDAYNRREIPHFATACSTIDTYQRRETPRRGTRCSTDDTYNNIADTHYRKETPYRDTDCSNADTYHRKEMPRRSTDYQNPGSYQRRTIL